MSRNWLRKLNGSDFNYDPIDSVIADPTSVNPTGTGATFGFYSVSSANVASNTEVYVRNGGMTFHLLFNNDDNPTGAFMAGIEEAASLLSAAIPHDIIVNLKINFSGTGGNADAKPNNGAYVDYSLVRDALQAAGCAGSSGLPSGDSINGCGQVEVWNAQGKVLGLMPNPKDTTTDDGEARFSTDIPASNLVGVALHELTHALGRVPYYGWDWGTFANEPDIMQFYRYSSPGHYYFDGGDTTASASYFSLDGGGYTEIADYGQNSDPSDFLNAFPFKTPSGKTDPASPNSPEDPFDQAWDGNTIQHLTASDLDLLSALGFSPTGLQYFYFVATESKTGDYYSGYVYDSTGTYHPGYTYTGGTDQVGGHWTYSITSIGYATNSGTSGYVYDFGYYDADLGGYSTVYGYNGQASGTNYLGSDYDYIYSVGGYQEFGGAYYVVPDVNSFYFKATESKTGDVYYGYVYDSTGTYYLGYTTTGGVDQAGGRWTYTITSNALSAASGISGSVYDYAYYDADLATWSTPKYFDAGFTSGSSYLGSDSDYVNAFGSDYQFGQSYYVVPESSKLFNFVAHESKTGDSYYGWVYDNTNTYYVGYTYSPSATDQAGGKWTYSIYGGGYGGYSPSLSGYVYDSYYYDADYGGSTPYYYSNGNSSGYGGLGSDYDYAYDLGSYYLFGYGYNTVPENSKLFYFIAQESATGDYYYGLVYDNTGTYYSGYTYSPSATDQAGGKWTYSIYSSSSSSYSPSLSGYVYDTSYYDTDLGSFSTEYGYNGSPSGTTGLGSDYDYIYVNGLGDQQFGGGDKVVSDSFIYSRAAATTQSYTPYSGKPNQTSLAVTATSGLGSSTPHDTPLLLGFGTQHS
jgi:hypothetical protein